MSMFFVGLVTSVRAFGGSCREIDLGAWGDERFRVPAAPSSADEATPTGAPRGTPPEVVAKISRDILAVMQQPEFRDDMIKRAYGVPLRTPEQFAAVIAEHRHEAESWKRLEREFLEFQARLPLDYVRREDYIRGQTVIEAKIDAVYSKLEVVLLKGVKHD